MVVNAAGNDERPAAHDLVLKDSYSRDFASCLLAGKQFTAQSIRSANQERGNSLIAGRTLLNCTKLVLKNWKKAVGFGVAFLNHNGSLPSGKTEDD